MNPTYSLSDGWYAGLINDGATVRQFGDQDYYPQSRSNQNIELIPFSTAPFHVAVTIKDVQAGEELFTSYGYRYWENALRNSNGMIDHDHNNEEEQDEKFKEILADQESQVVEDIHSTLNAINLKYSEESWVLGQIFDHEMTSEKPPSLSPPMYKVPKKRKRDKLKEKLQVILLRLKKQNLPLLGGGRI